MRTTWPLFYCLEPEVRAALMQHQWDTYHTLLDLPSPPGASQDVTLDAKMESPEEIDKLMRQAPSRSRRTK
jgi:hypothetical protein